MKSLPFVKGRSVCAFLHLALAGFLDLDKNMLTGHIPSELAFERPPSKTIGGICELSFGGLAYAFRLLSIRRLAVTLASEHVDRNNSRGARRSKRSMYVFAILSPLQSLVELSSLIDTSRY